MTPHSSRASSRAVIPAIFLIFLLLPSHPHAAAPVQLTVLHMNDLHGHILSFADKNVSADMPVGGAAAFGGLIREERARNPDGTLLLSAGDMFQGTPVSNVFRGEPVIFIMNHLRFDAMALGNHEFDWGLSALDRLRSLADFPFLSSNITDASGRNLPGVKSYVLLKRKGLSIAVIGVTTPETRYSTKPANVSNLVFLDPAKAIIPLIREVRRQGASFIIVLSHLGLDADKKLAARVRGINLIVGGHTHTVVNNPLKVRKTIITQAGCYGLYLGIMQLTIDSKTGSILGYTTQNELEPVIAEAKAPVDAEAAHIADEYNNRVKAEFSKEVGETRVDLLRRADGESNVGNLIGDAMREDTGADIAFQNGGGIRTDLPKGKITLEEVYTLLPFDNLLVTMDLKGSQVLSALEWSVASGSKVLQVSGISVTYDMSRAAGSRVVSATVRHEPLKPERTYRVTTNDFLAAGGDRFKAFMEGRNPIYGDTIRDAFTMYLRKHSPVSPAIENRVVFIGQ